MKQEIEVVPVEVRRELAAAAPPEPTAPAAAPNPLVVAHGLLRGRYPWAIVLGLVLAIGGVLAGYRLTPVKYRSAGLIIIKAYVPRVIYPTDPMQNIDAVIESQVSLLRSQRVIDRAMLNPDWAALKRGLDPEVLASFADALEVVHPKNTEIIQISFTDKDRSAATAAVRAMVTAFEEIYAESNKDEGKLRLDALEERRTALTNELKGLNERILGMAQEFGSDSLGPIFDFKLQELNKLEVQLNEIRQAHLATAQGDVAPTTGPAASQPAVVRAATNPREEVDRSPEIIALVDRDMAGYLADRQKLLADIERWERKLGPQHTAVIDARADLARVNAQIKERTDFFARAEAAGMLKLPGVVDAVPQTQEDLDRLLAREKRFEAQYQAAKAEVLALGRRNLDIRKLRDDATMVSQRLDETKLRIDQLNLESSVGRRLEIISRGDKPLQPSSDRRKAVAGAAGVGGFAMGLGFFMLLGLLDRRLRHIDDARASLAESIPLLGILPELPTSLEDPEQARLAGQCVHHIRALLQIGSAPGHDKVYTITSPSAGAGKTSLAAALGLSFAASGARVLLIDGDIVGGGLTAKLDTIIRRRIGQILRREGLVNDDQIAQGLRDARAAGGPLGEALVQAGFVSEADVAQALAVQQRTVVGLLDVLSGEPLGECVTGAGIPGLFILPLGDAGAHHVPQLSPAAIRRIFAEARAAYDIVLVDTGPILGSLEAAVAAPESDAVILVMSRGEHKPLARRAVEFLFLTGCRVAGAVFNRATHADIISSSYSSPASLRSLSSRRTQRTPAERALALGPIASAARSATEPAQRSQDHA